MTHTRLPTLAYLPCSCKDTSFTCLSNRTLWDQIRPQHKAEQTVRYLLIPCKKLFIKRVGMIVLRKKRKRAFLPQNSSKLREWQMLTSCVSFWVKHAGGFRCYWPHFETLLLCPQVDAIVLLSYKSAYLQTFIVQVFRGNFIFFQRLPMLEFHNSRR
uniref:Uncharacterized protein n=1 Tax=Rhipicephalus appendiculatus TaxID=34631 RepID=A0A131YFR9_RHIAP